MLTDEIREELLQLQDTNYRDFQSKLIPTADPETFIGVRTPELRKLAKQLIKREDIRSFLEDLPHHTFDENQLHAFLLSERKDYETCIKEVEQFLPFVDNWATCDQHFLDEDFDPSYPEMVAELRSDEYYINMMIAWYFATALAKQYDSVLPFLEKHRLDVWTHNKTIQKSVESYRITPEQKAYLKSIKRKTEKPTSIGNSKTFTE